MRVLQRQPAPLICFPSAAATTRATQSVAATTRATHMPVHGFCTILYARAWLLHTTVLEDEMLRVVCYEVHLPKSAKQHQSQAHLKVV